MADSTENPRIVRINIEDEMKTAYIDYSMSVIVSRALPDVRDGLKPVHRRVLYGMLDLGVASNRPHKKSARIVGEVLGKYHPHGDTAVYDTMVRMAQDWSLRYPLIDGQGNFGSIEGDTPAAMRYTEARLRKMAEDMLADIEKDTVDFRNNFDDTLQEPTVLPAKVPNLLINGASGIAVGMATNMPPHNLTEVLTACMAYIDNREITTDELAKIVLAPDFPTGGIIYGVGGVRQAYETGRGRVIIRARANIETLDNGRERIVITEVPYQMNFEDTFQKIKGLIDEKKLEGISDFRNESSKNVRIVFDLKRDAIGNVVLNNLYKQTALQTSFSVNNIALVHGRPVLLNLKDLISNWVTHRHEVLVRKTRFELADAEKRAHILEGLLIALDHLDEVIALIRASQTPDEARNGLITQFNLSEIQARAILDMRLQRLTGLERDKIKDEYAEIMKFIEYCKEVLADESKRMGILKAEMLEMKERYGDERKSEIVYSGEDISMEDMIADDHVIVTISHLGYIKRTPLTEYRTQSRGGRGSVGSAVRDEDFVEHLFSCTNHNYILLFTEKGRCFWLRAFAIPEGNKQSKGRAIQNLINIPADDKVKAYINVKDLEDEEYINNNYLIMATKKGVIKKTVLEAYSRVRVSGINAINIEDGDELLEVKLTNGKNEIVLAVKSGRAIRFNESTVRAMGRTATGVTGVRFDEPNDEVVGMVCINDTLNETILVVSENGFGKRSDIEDYRVTNRGGKGVSTIKVTEKTGKLIAIKSVIDSDDLMIITESGITIRMPVKDLRVMGRATQGVKLIRLEEGDQIASVCKIDKIEDEDDLNQFENGQEIGDGINNSLTETTDENPENNNLDSTDSTENNN